jgi:hypothetical protein
MIRQKRGLERIRVFITGLRGYLCRDCETAFRAPDRRATPRDGKMPAGVFPRQI